MKELECLMASNQILGVSKEQVEDELRDMAVEGMAIFIDLMKELFSKPLPQKKYGAIIEPFIGYLLKHEGKSFEEIVEYLYDLVSLFEDINSELDESI